MIILDVVVDMVRETERQPVKAIRVRRLVPERPGLASKAVRCLYTEEFPSAASRTGTRRK